MLYCPGNGQVLLSALGVTLVCHASNVFLVLKVPLSIIDEFSKSMTWLLDQAWLAILEPLAAILVFLKCSLFRVLKTLLVSPIEPRTISLPYIKGVTEPLTRFLKKHDVTVVNKAFTTLQQQFPAPKFRPSMESQTKAMYQIVRCVIFGRAVRGNILGANVLKLERKTLGRQQQIIF